MHARDPRQDRSGQRPCRPLRVTNVSAGTSVILVMLMAASARAVDPVPAVNRLPTSIAATLTAPAADPMHMPTDVALDSAGRAYVADGAKNRIVIFRPDGSFDRTLKSVGDEKLSRPIGLFVDATDQLWIADTGNHRVLVVAPDDRLVSKIELPTPPDGRPSEPTDVVTTPDGRRAYFPDHRNHRLAIRDNQTGEVTFLGHFGEGLGEFRWPFMIAIGPDGYIFVTEVIGARVQRFTHTHRPAGRLGEWGVELGQLYRPKGVAVDSQGRVYAGDSTLGAVQVFSPHGAVIGVLTDPTGRPLKLKHPMGLSLDTQNRLYVVELEADRVSILTLPPSLTPLSPTTRPATRPEEGHK